MSATATDDGRTDGCTPHSACVQYASQYYLYTHNETHAPAVRASAFAIFGVLVCGSAYRREQ